MKKNQDEKSVIFTMMHQGQQENQMSNQCVSCHQLYRGILKEQPEKSSKLQYNPSQYR